jgi:hypothetical protein
MVEKYVDRSRRSVIGTIVQGLAAGLLPGISRALASDKMTRQQAQYQDKPNGIYSCANCSLFERPKSCKVVEGDVSEDGWCKAFAFVD